MKVECNIKSLIVHHDLEKGTSTFQLVCNIFGEDTLIEASPRMVSIIESVLQTKEEEPEVTPAPAARNSWGFAELEDPEEIEQA